MPEEPEKQSEIIKLPTTEPEQQIAEFRLPRFLLPVFLFLLIVLIGNFFYKYLQTPPSNFPIEVPIEIEKGTSLSEAVKIAKDTNLVRSEFALYVLMLLEHKDNSIKASTYVFERPLSLSELALELTKGNHRADLVKITNTEGETAIQIADRAYEILTNFDKETFIQLARPNEGKLFPDTYLIPKNFTAEELYELLTTTFEQKISAYEEEILNHQLTLDEIIILASILEREANSVESKRYVSGILQRRLSISMPLQVDASLEYVLNKPLKDLTAEDLDTDSPYNTYLNYGLTPTPIGNPGIEAIEAVLNPIESDYLFYITGDDGNFYYAKNFDGHRLNIEKYLR